MIDPVGPAKRSSASRRVGSRASATNAARGGEASGDRLALPAPDGDVAEPTPDEAAGAAAYAAQVMSGGPRRGLKGGPDTLERARATYLETEWSGPADRRLARGGITKAEI
jgi:hypothetical protein